SQWMRIRIPTIEAAHHGNLARIRRPHTEAGADFAIYAGEVRSKLVMNAVVIALIEKIDILLRQKTDGSGALRYVNNFLRHVSIALVTSVPDQGAVTC